MAENLLSPPKGYNDPSNPLYAGAPTWADAAQWHAQNLRDTAAAMRDPQMWVDAAQQYGNAMLMGTTAPGGIVLFRGIGPSSRMGGNFYSTDREFARQFTRSGEDSQILTRHILPEHVYEPPSPVYAGDDEAVDAAIEAARKLGKGAVRLSEAKGSAPGEGEPASLFVFDSSILSRKPHK